VFATRNETLPKLILLDLDMPRAGGLEVLRQLRDYPPTKELPVAILTASLKQSDFFQTQEMGVWDYLVKPVSTQGLMDLVSQIGL
jgi:two-component system response regulator